MNSSNQEAALAQAKMLYHTWLEHPSTRQFFAALDKRKAELLEAAALAAVTVGSAERRDIFLIRARELMTIIETYAKPNEYPYPIPKSLAVSSDDTDTEIVIPIGTKQ